MTENEYNNKMDEITDKFEMAKKQLYVEYAKSHRIFKIGDIISNRNYIICIEKYSTSINLDLPKPVYIGSILKKDLTPEKDNILGYVYGNEGVSLIKANNEIIK